MKIKKMELRNIGPFEDKTFEMSQMMFLFEENGYGKSTFLKALNYGLDGDFEKGLMRKGADECSVTLCFDDGFVVERCRKGGTLSSKMGFGTAKTASKAAVSTELSRRTGVAMDSLKVIASSMDLFNMQPEQLGEFFMRHIPNRMTVDQVLSYITGLTPAMEEEIRKALPSSTEFGQSSVELAFAKFDAARKEQAREVRKDSATIEKYDFSQSFRKPQEIQSDLNKLMQRKGAQDEKKKAYDRFLQMKKQREETLAKLRKLQAEYNQMRSVQPPDPQAEEQLRQQEEFLRNQINSISEMRASNKEIMAALSQAVNALKSGLCPQMDKIKCPYDWTKHIADLTKQLERLGNEEARLSKGLQDTKKNLDDVLKKRAVLEQDRKDYEAKKAKLDQYNNLKPNLIELPPEPEKTSEDFSVQQKAYEKELRDAITHQQMMEIKDSLDGKKQKLELLTNLSRAFSKKGEVMEKNLSYYLNFFGSRMNEKAEKIGYQVKLDADNGLHILIGRTGSMLIDIGECSQGEKAVAIFLLLDILNAVTGVRMLFMDEIEILDNEVWEKLLNVANQCKEDYDHIIFAGVNHSDLLTTINSRN